MRDGASLYFSHLGESSIGQPFEGACRDGQICKIDFEFSMKFLVVDLALFAFSFFQLVVVEVLAGLRGFLSDTAL